MLVTLAGMEIDSMLLHSKKASLPMLVTLAGRVTDVKLVQL